MYSIPSSRIVTKISLLINVEKPKVESDALVYRHENLQFDMETVFTIDDIETSEVDC